jgi:hypothetical protein
MKNGILPICIVIIIMGCNKKTDEESPPPHILKAGDVPESFLVHHQYGPDTIYKADKYYDFNNDSIRDLLFHSSEFEYDDHGRIGYGCESSIYIVDSTLKVAPFTSMERVDIIHYGDKIDSTLRWDTWQNYGWSVRLNSILSTRGVFDKFYWDSTGYIGLNYGNSMGWLKIKVEGCSKIILYECLIE